ncbi:hypothetical protein B0H19DRAFT_1367472 [Mycena capillaripes]|nr:hypothetical protein B0H19DRAFT_1367472 [Mycena capillaripes]
MLASLEADPLQAQQAVVWQKRLDSYQYPVLTLANEIVGEIFLHFLPAYPLCPPLSGTSSPIIWTQICHEWREIALTTPALWRAISLTRDEDSYALSLSRHDLSLSQRIHRSNTWLRRSGCCPLSIQIDAHGATELLAAAAPHSARWEYLKLHDNSWQEPSQVTALEGPMPSLRHLDLDIYLTQTDVLTLGAVPLLRSLTLQVLVPTNVVLPWGQLTSLTLPSVAPLDFVPLLQQTHNLVHCTLGLDFSLDGSGKDLPELTLPFLESLTLIRKRGAVDLRLTTFIVPALRRLDTSRGDRPNELASFIAKSGCKLQEVRITGDRVVSRTEYREEFPSIQFSFAE